MASSRTAKPAKSPDLTRQLAHTIKPTAGPAAHLETIADAAQLIADLEMLMRAAKTGRKPDVAEATRCVMVALEKENWLKAR